MIQTAARYKQTSIGRIPKEWEVVRVEDIFEVYGGTTPSTSNKEYWSGNIFWVTPTDVTNLNGKLELDETEKKITEKAVRENSLRVLQPGTLLLTSRATIGFTAINSKPVTINQGMAALIKRNENNVDETFYAHYFSLLKTYLEQLGAGSTFKEISKSTIKKLKIPLPPLPEQRRIAEILSTVDQAIQRVDEAIARTERLKRGLMQRLLTRGIGHKEFKFSEELDCEIPKEWVVVRLGDVVKIHDSKRIPLSEMERANRRGIYPYCGANGIIDYIDDYIFDGEFILLAEDGGAYGKFENTAYIMNGRFWVNNHAHILKAMDEKTSNLFLLFVLNFLDIRRYIVGSTRTKLNQEQLREIKLPLPPPAEQQKIVSMLSTVDKKIELERKRKEKLERIKKSLMNDLLTGRKRLKFG